MYLAAGASHPVVLEHDPFITQFFAIFEPVLPILILLVVVGLILLGLTLWDKSSPTTYIAGPVNSTPKPAPKLPPANPVPAEVQQLAQQLKAAAEKVKAPADKHNLRRICDTIPVFYKRHKELGGDSTYTVALEGLLPHLVAAMPTYLQIQENPALYRLGGSGDRLYLNVASPKKRLRQISQAIQNYLDLLQAAMRDDSKLEVAALDLTLSSLLASGSSQRRIALQPWQQKAAMFATDFYGKAKAQLRK